MNMNLSDCETCNPKKNFSSPSIDISDYFCILLENCLLRYFKLHPKMISYTYTKTIIIC